MPVTRNLPSLVRSKFVNAQEAGDLVFYPTQVCVLQPSGFSFQLRYSPALASKPKVIKAPNSKPVDVFHNPTKLLVTEWPPSHNLVLNKFAINANHFILATKDWKAQTDLLEEGDLAATYECIQSYKESGEALFAFFNSGEHSGASQPHRHVQFLPVESMHQGIASEDNWSLLANFLLEEPKADLPFTYFSSPIPSSPTSKQLHEIYLNLYRQAVDKSRTLSPKDESSQPTASPEAAAICYNLVVTERVMVLCPRKAEGIKVTDTDGKEVGPITLNGTLLGGTLLVKSEDEWNALRKDESQLYKILRAIGVPFDAFASKDTL